jgi:hypothetical protein
VSGTKAPNPAAGAELPAQVEQAAIGPPPKAQLALIRCANF